MTSHPGGGRARPAVAVGPGKTAVRARVPIAIESLLAVDVVSVTIAAGGATAVAVDPDGRRVTFEASPHVLVKVAELLATGRESVRIRTGADGVRAIEPVGLGR